MKENLNLACWVTFILRSVILFFALLKGKNIFVSTLQYGYNACYTVQIQVSIEATTV
jgi:hypothetical protein